MEAPDFRPLFWGLFIFGAVFGVVLAAAVVCLLFVVGVL